MKGIYLLIHISGDWLALELNTVSGDEDIFNGTFICDLVNLGIQGSDNVCDTGVFCT